MPRLLSLADDGTGQAHPIRQARTAIGRRSFNDIIIQHRSASGEHALLTVEGGEVYVEDLDSTNGTWVNGRSVKRQLLRHNDLLEIGGCQFRYLADDGPATVVDADTTRPNPAFTTGPAPLAHTMPAGLPTQPAVVKVLTGEAAGREMVLTKVVTTIGKPGFQLASISRRPSGFVLAHVEGEQRPSINGVVMISDAMGLRDGDVIDLAGTRMQLICG